MELKRDTPNASEQLLSVKNVVESRRVSADEIYAIHPQ
jgi:hypothetical protein